MSTARQSPKLARELLPSNNDPNESLSNPHDEVVQQIASLIKDLPSVAGLDSIAKLAAQLRDEKEESNFSEAEQEVRQLLDEKGILFEEFIRAYAKGPTDGLHFLVNRLRKIAIELEADGLFNPAVESDQQQWGSRDIAKWGKAPQWVRDELKQLKDIHERVTRDHMVQLIAKFQRPDSDEEDES
ncbi:MAG: hypothetical protein HQL55_12285 [Magnetococcales bacterium]|nr:hypothetical protein [Magnetococcales bacterium]